MITTIDHLPSRIIKIDGSEYLFFSGTSYLGMGHQQGFREALLEGISQYGTVFSASRNNNLRLKIYEESEDFIANWTGSEAALTVSSGLVAGQLVVQSLANQKFIFAPATHPAIWQANSPPQYLFKNFDDFSRKIVGIVAEETEAIVIAANAIDPLLGEPFDFSWVMDLPNNKSITLLLDDSHGIGITGTEGSGIFRKIKKWLHDKPQISLIVIASLAKAVGIPGGVILADKKTITGIRQNPMFVGASPIVPAYLFAFLNAQKTYSEARTVLQKNIEQFRNALTENPTLPITYLPDYPVFFTQKRELFAYLWEHKIMISSFSYPKPTDPPITRMIVSALHTEGDIFSLSEKLKMKNNKATGNSRQAAVHIKF